jgi:hypothetical protein
MTQEELEAQIAEDFDPGLSGSSVAALFSAHLDAEEIPFTIGECKQESSATLRPMDADKLSRYRDSVSRFSTVEGQETKFYFEPATAESEVALLLGTVEAMTIFWDKPVVGGGTTVEQIPFPKPGPGRILFFQRMHPDLRKKLVHECKRVNGLHPAVPK